MKKMRSILTLLLALGLVLSLAAADQVHYLIVKGIVGTNYYNYPGGQRQLIRNTGLRLYKGVKITTGAGGQLKLSFPGSGSQILLQGRTTVEVSRLITQGGQYSSSMALRAGRMRAIIDKIFGNDFNVRTKSAVAGVRGTDLAATVGAGGKDRFFVFDGKIAVQGVKDGGALTPAKILNKGQSIGIGLGGLLTPIRRISRRDAGLFQVDYKKLFSKATTGDTGKDTSKDTSKDTGKDTGKDTSSGTTGSTGSTTVTPPPDKTGKDSSGSGKSSSSSTGPSWLGAGIGPEVIGDTTYTKMVLAPKISAGKFKIKLYLPIIYDANNPIWEAKKWYNYDEWNFSSLKDAIHDLLLKIQYVQFGEKEEKVHIRLGSIDDFVVGHGFMMNHYNNAINYPDTKRVGAMFDLKFKAWGFESMIGDIYRGDIFGGRLYFMPFKGLFKSFAIGASYITDINADPTNSINTNAVVATAGLDVELPLPSLGILTWKLFADYSRMMYKTEAQEYKMTDGYGYTFGVYGRLLFFKYKLAYRYLRNGFVPEYFDSFYETNRAQKFADFLAGASDDYNGWVFEMGFQKEKLGEIKVHFQTYDGGIAPSANKNNKLALLIRLDKGVIPKFHFQLEYERKDIDNFKGFFDNMLATSIATLSLYYEVGAGVEMVGTYRRFYDEVGGFTDNYYIQTQIGF